MIKVLVYGGEKETEDVANFLESEMPVEVKKLIAKRELKDLSTAEILEITERDLVGIIGKNELIVLANPFGAIATGKELKRRYPEQKFVWYGQGIEREVQKFRMLYVLTSLKIKRLEVYQRMKARCQGIQIVEDDSVGWKEMTEKGKVEKEEVTEKVKSTRGAPIIVFHPELSFSRIREIVDWRGEVIDIERGLLSAIKAILGLKKWC